MDQSLIEKANLIPSMGGMEIGPALRKWAGRAGSGTAIVEVGCWLGAGTAQLALGVLENQNPAGIRMHCYDRWTANEAEIEKAARWGLRLNVGEDLLPHVKRMLKPFDIPIDFHQGDIRTTSWNAGPISVYVDDASKIPKLFFHSLRTFGPSWVPGETIVFLMDFDIWKKTGKKEHQCQKEFIEAHPASFERLPHAEVAVFRYCQSVDFNGWIISSLEAEIKQLREKEDELRQLKSSISWRITSPLRKARRALIGTPRRR
jgi:hypothetical protein